MNIQNRIKKLEKLIIMPESEFCDCFDIHFRKMVDLVYNNAPYDEDAAALPVGDYCDKCKKSVPPRNLELIENINKIYGDATINELI